MLSFINGFLSPKKFFFLTSQLQPWLHVLFIFAFSYGIIGGLMIAPPDNIQGDGFRIIYVHVPCAFLSLFIYGVMAIAALGSLIFRLKLAPLVIRESITLGAGFTFLALLTGSLWGKPMWGTWWIWDARLTSELILLFLYLGIYLFQSALADKHKNERLLAILILIGFIDIPIIHYSVYWWNTLHQGSSLNLFTPTTIDNSMLYPLLSMIAAFLIFYAIVLFSRIHYELIVRGVNSHWLREKK